MLRCVQGVVMVPSDDPGLQVNLIYTTDIFYDLGVVPMPAPLAVGASFLGHLGEPAW